MTQKDQAGLLSPFRRDLKRDFASTSGFELLQCKVLQTLMTEGFSPLSSGELPWRTAFGSSLTLLRHQNNNTVLVELARVYIRDALKKWIPSAEVKSVEVISDKASITLKLRIKEKDTAAEHVIEVVL